MKNFATISNFRYLNSILLGIIILLGILFRLDNIGTFTMGHEEMYVPGIELPYDLSDPRPRLSIWKTITGTVAAEPHPPGYYVMMFGWTKLFGTGVLALRMPSLFFGVASILLIYFLGSLEKNKFTGLLAAGMLAFNGLHVFWSQPAKMYSMGCFLGLLSTLLLLLMSKAVTQQRIFQVLYIAVTLAGLSTVVFFWLILVTHILWTIKCNCTNKTPMPGLLRSQILVFIIGSPLLAFVAYQSRRSSYIREDILTTVGHFLQFGFLFEPHRFSFSPPFMPSYAIIFLVLTTSFLFMIGLMSNRAHKIENTIIIGPPTIVMILSGVLAFCSILLFAKFAHIKDPSRTGLIIALLLFFDYLLRRYGCHMQIIRNFLNKIKVFPDGLNSLNSFLAIIPVTILAGISVFIPIFASRTALLFIPYFIIFLCTGLVSLIYRDRRWIILLLILATFHSLSVLHYKNRRHHPANYKALAERLIPNIEDSDLIFIERSFTTTPIFYYLNANKYHFVGRNYSKYVYRNPDSRVWVLSLKWFPPNEGMKTALTSHELLMSINALNIKAELYSP
jgi:uncharacterized membrane protein